jgi:hypothetical protein
MPRVLQRAKAPLRSDRAARKTWTRIRLNLRNVPGAERPSQEKLEVGYDPWEHRRR